MRRIGNAVFVLPEAQHQWQGTFLEQIRQANRDAFFTCDGVADTITHCLVAPLGDAQGVSIATWCIVAPRADAQKNYNDYRRVLIDSANSLARRINE